jgi:4-carboxymuconolactone decarboxylase
MPFYFNMALDNGVKPRELSEIITHLAFYSGWPNAMSAVVVAKDIFAQRAIGSDQLPARSPELLPLNPSAEAQRVASVDQQLGSGFPGLVQYTTDVLFRDLWLRPDLVPRDRSLVTVSALIASGQFAQLSGHLTRAMNNGLTQAQAGEMVTQLAFYAGWPNAFTAAPIIKTAFEKRSSVLAHGVGIAAGIVKRHERTDEHDGSFQQELNCSPRRLTNRCRSTITAAIESSLRGS